MKRESERESGKKKWVWPRNAVAENKEERFEKLGLRAYEGEGE